MTDSAGGAASTGQVGLADQPPSIALARALAEALPVSDVVVCPGSRDAPLLYEYARLAHAGRTRVHVRLDERSAGFMALGCAKAALLHGHVRPAIVVTTSGTAVANLHPAVMEADAAGVPLIVITANRPEELWHTRANQTTVQPGVFGHAPRFEAHIPVEFPLGSTLHGLCQRLMAAACGTLTRDPGPVHLDVSFREPLVPTFAATSNATTQQEVELNQAAFGAGQVAPRASSSVPRRASVQPTVLQCPPRTVVVAGDGAGAAAAMFAQEGGWPLLAEPSSGARCGPCALTHYQQVLTHTALDADVEHVVVFGHPTLSRPITALLRGAPAVTVVADTARWVDTVGNASVVMGPVSARVSEGLAQAGWMAQWRDADLQVAPAATARTAQTPEDAATAAMNKPAETNTPARAANHTEIAQLRAKDRVCAAIWEASCHPGAPALMLGASDVIRAFDRHAMPAADAAHAPLVASNRGLAGIDGTVSSALGLNAGLGRAVRVVVGDLTAIHDMGGLVRGRTEGEPDVQVLVLNDAGGAIFAGLEHAQAPRETLERFFLTAQVMDFQALAGAVGATFTRITMDRERTDTGLHQLTELLSRPVHGRSMIEVTLPG